MADFNINDFLDKHEEKENPFSDTDILDLETELLDLWGEE